MFSLLFDVLPGKIMKTCFAVLVVCLTAFQTVGAQPVVHIEQSSFIPSDQWGFSVTPYAWAMGIRGTVSHDTSRLGKLRLSPGNVLSDLKFGGMLVAQATRGPLGIYLDAMYGDLGTTTSSVVRQTDLDAGSRVKMTMVTFAPAYRLYDSSALKIDGLAGVRYLRQDVRSTISGPLLGGSLSKSTTQHVTDVIAGFKGRWNLGHSNYFVPFYVDAGAGQVSSLTSQVYVGIGHAFDWGDVSVVAKNVYYQFRQNSTTVDLNMLGVAAGVTFRF